MPAAPPPHRPCCLLLVGLTVLLWTVPATLAKAQLWPLPPVLAAQQGIWFLAPHLLGLIQLTQDRRAERGGYFETDPVTKGVAYLTWPFNYPRLIKGLLCSSSRAYYVPAVGPSMFQQCLGCRAGSSEQN